MTERQGRRRAGVLLVLGELIFLIAGLFHPGREQANDHRAVFAEYAQSSGWIAVHLGQFVGSALLLAGLLALIWALDLPSAGPGWTARLTAAAALVTLALTAVLQAVDGVALKHAVDAWQAAPASERPATFATAEVIRWLEWAIRSYQRFTLGMTLLLFGTTIVWSGRISRPVGYLAGVLGLDYWVQGWILGAEGFAPAASIPTLVGLSLELVWVLWLATIVWRAPDPGLTR